MGRKPIEISKADFKKLYFNNTNEEVAKKLMVSKQTVHNLANKLGFKKGVEKVKVIDDE
jgi:hypothetical protein